ncbi:hypothetical protein D9758_005779 [Tetrapyrgos nigripes]|uniref:F-box domain-containing protein n=1 Tax=Tetrapyrgos nigripes TaxID=182062 RepID=A0A8H5GJL7_9AGAR|nr:hypothetical protein D9758_005779 [Tetrapyrgos nigripes]
MRIPSPCFSPPNEDNVEAKSQHLSRSLAPASAPFQDTPVFTPPLSHKVFSGTTVLANDSRRRSSTASSPSLRPVVVSETKPLSPLSISNLPVEMLLEIFKWACPAESPLSTENTTGPRAPPVIILSQVCKHWRAVIHEACILWQHLLVAPRAGRTALRCPVAEWLSRVGNHLPIDVHITDVNLGRDFTPPTSYPEFQCACPRLAALNQWLVHVPGPTACLGKNLILDELLPHLLIFSSSFRSLRTHLPAWSYIPKSGSLGLLQHAPLELPKLQSLDLTFSYMGWDYSEIKLNRHKRLYDEAFVDNVSNTFSVAPELKFVRIAFDGVNDRRCEMYESDDYRGGNYRTGLEILDLPYHQLATLYLENVTTTEPSEMRRILAAGVNLETVSLTIGWQDGSEDLYTDFDHKTYDKYSFGIWNLVEQDDDVDGVGLSDNVPEGMRRIPPPVPPTLTNIPDPDATLGGTVSVAQLTKLKSLRVTLQGTGGAAMFLRGFSFPALEELIIVHAIRIPHEAIDIATGASDTNGDRISSVKARTRQQLIERVRASLYPYDVLGSSLLYSQHLSSSFSSLRSLRLENLQGVNATHLLQFVKGVGASLNTLYIQYCPNVDLGVFAEGMSELDDNGLGVLAPNLQTFHFEADLTHSGGNPNDIVNMLARRICPTSPRTACADDDHRTMSRVTSIAIRFFGRKDFTEDSRKHLWKFQAFHKVKVKAKCWP